MPVLMLRLNASLPAHEPDCTRTAVRARTSAPDVHRLRGRAQAMHRRERPDRERERRRSGTRAGGCAPPRAL
eukprot:1730268-Pleurochrysis_carterae.AAC.1